MKAPVFLEVSAGFCIRTVLLLLILPHPWAIAMIAAAIFHEAAHILAIMTCGGNIYSIKLGMSGVQILTPTLNYLKEAITAAAGPLGSFLLLILYHVFPQIAVCGLMQGAYNLLPMYPMDGGRILNCFLVFFFGREKAAHLMTVIQSICMIFILASGCVFCLKYDLYAFLPVLILEIVLKVKKFLEKGGSRQYNRIDYES